MRLLGRRLDRPSPQFQPKIPPRRDIQGPLHLIKTTQQKTDPIPDSKLMFGRGETKPALGAVFVS